VRTRDAFLVAAALTPALLGLVVFPAVAGSSPEQTVKKQKCNKECEKSNDYYLHAPHQDYRDYFVSDSDGDKDLVFADFVYEPFEGAKCKVLKNDSSNNYSVAAVLCLYNGQLVISGVPGARGPTGASG
jgi:hypothetical protein